MDLEIIDAYKFDIMLKIMLDQSEQIIVDKDIYQEQVEEREQAILDRRILAYQLLDMKKKIREKEQEIENSQNHLKDLHDKVREETEKNELFRGENKGELEK
ncbi:hypothetical protein L873DRAFT_1824227 [Choiromyces venosus 120613-1]|uniref:Uncharacterized protein n=1 Tax=Choiromyces venosus 120613-1 TaxID=1336337 RepID=A0A3N4IS58_9PEZI|nr:hypothetical protein L873DRAFT_1824227 [Choiromyces venosus 120613-1]